MSNRRRGLASGVLGVIHANESELTLTLFSRERRVVAVVIGSERYLLRALVAVGLAPPVAALAKDRRRPELPFVRKEPSKWSPKDFREANDGGCLDSLRSAPALLESRDLSGIDS